MTAPAPLTSTTFVPNEKVTASKLYTRVFTVINYLLTASATTTQNRFFGSILSTSFAITANTNINFTGKIIEDTANGWNSTNKNWVCPSAGTYAYLCQSKCDASGTAPVIAIYKNSTRYSLGPACPNAAFSGQNIGGFIRLAVGDTVAMQSLVSYATQNDTPAHNNYMMLWQTSFG